MHLELREFQYHRIRNACSRINMDDVDLVCGDGRRRHAELVCEMSFPYAVVAVAICMRNRRNSEGKQYRCENVQSFIKSPSAQRPASAVYKHIGSTKGSGMRQCRGRGVMHAHEAGRPGEIRVSGPE